MVCPVCASPVTDGARFCWSCGTSLVSAPTDERRIVTVLFADLVGYTTLAERQDPESVKRLIDGCFERLVDDIVAFGGRVDKMMGDAILALFGAPIAHEDDAERAVRAGLRMQQTVTAYALLNRQDGLRMRIGINTGEVLTGTLAGSDYTAMGDAVNAAARLQALAEPGSVVVGASTHALTAHTIRYAASDEQQLRGRDQPMQVWTAEEATAPPGGRRRRRDGPMVGRVAELRLADAALKLALDDRHGVVLTVIGDSGVGKNRLADELLGPALTGRGLDDDVTVLRGACVPYGESNAWWPIASALTGYLDLDPGASLDLVRDSAAARARRLGEHLDDEAVDQLVDCFVHLLGLPSPLDALDPQAVRAAVHRGVHQVISLQATRRPFILAISDMQWADPVVVDLLNHLVTSLHRLPFALVTTLRPGGDVAWPPHSERLTSTLIHLHPLSAEETSELAASLLDGESTPQLLDALFERSGGNPLFLEELTALAVRGHPLSDLPDSLRALIAARLDELTIDQRHVIDNAATLGTAGTIGALQRFAEAMHQAFDHVTVDELEDMGLLERQGRRWSFRSNSVRDAAYQTLTKANRALRHAGVATAIGPAAPHTLDDLAHHLATAAELSRELGGVPGVSSTITSEAVEVLTAAARRATDIGAAQLAIRQAGRALDLVPADDLRRDDLLLIRAANLTERRLFDEARADIATLLGRAGEREDGSLQGEARARLGSLLYLEGDRRAARVELDRAIELLRQAGRSASLAAALRMRAFVELFGGEAPSAERFLAEADELFGALGDDRGRALVEQHRAWVSFISGDTRQATERLEHAAASLDRLGDRNGLGWASGLLAFVKYFERDFASAEAIATRVADEADLRGDEWASAMMQTLLANLRLWEGRLQDALGLAERSRQRFKRMGDQLGIFQSAAPLLRALVALGRNDDAQRIMEQLTARAESAALDPLPILAMAGAAMHRGDSATAVRLAGAAYDQSTANGTGLPEVAIVYAMSLAMAGRPEDAAIQLDKIDERQRDHPFYWSTSALVSALLGSDTEALVAAERATGLQGATYLDEIIADVAAAAALTRRGDTEEARQRLTRANERALTIGDVVAIALTRHALHRAAPAASAPTDQLAQGWHRVVDTLFADSATIHAH
jgi:class 3 adenylate cyclase/tetratricopeptide (TPR) repeat protein